LPERKAPKGFGRAPEKYIGWSKRFTKRRGREQLQCEVIRHRDPAALQSGKEVFDQCRKSVPIATVVDRGSHNKKNRRRKYREYCPFGPVNFATECVLRIAVSGRACCQMLHIDDETP